MHVSASLFFLIPLQLIGEGIKVDQPVNAQLCLWSPLSSAKIQQAVIKEDCLPSI